MTAVPFSPKSPRLDQIASAIRTTWARVLRDVEATKRLLEEARDECFRLGRSFRDWCHTARAKIGIGRSQVYNILDGRTSSHLTASASPSSQGVHPVDSQNRRRIPKRAEFRVG